jgi:hypothetical protein
MSAPDVSADQAIMLAALWLEADRRRQEPGPAVEFNRAGLLLMRQELIEDVARLLGVHRQFTAAVNGSLSAVRIGRSGTPRK